MFNFKNKIAVLTGGAQGIGKCICEEFEKAGATVCVIDLLPNDYFVGDLADKATLERFAAKVVSDYGHVDYLINNAAPKMCGITDGSYEDFEYALKVGVTAPFYLSKLFAPHFAEGASIVNISSSRDRMSQPQTESYTAAKGCRSNCSKRQSDSRWSSTSYNSRSRGRHGDIVHECEHEECGIPDAQRWTSGIQPHQKYDDSGVAAVSVRFFQGNFR